MEKIELKKELTTILQDLKNDPNIIALKAEFGAEGASYEEVSTLKKLADETELELNLKIGGCEALRDIIDAKKLGIKNIVAPMIESSYALEKFIETTSNIYNLNDVNLYINIESKIGLENLDEITNNPSFHKLKGVVLGRSDLANSLGIKNVENEAISKIAIRISEITKKHAKKLIIGGGISVKSLEFIQNHPHLDKFETRKVIFNAKFSKNIKKSLQKALQFELLWLQSKRTLYAQDKQRIELLKSKLSS